MSESTARIESVSGTAFRGDLERTRLLLQVVYGLVPIVAGLDKVTTILTDWTAYLPTVIANALPVEPIVFMYVVGTIEVIAGVIVLTRYVEYGAYLVAAWLVTVAVTQVIAGNYDIAVRDVVMAVGAVALAQLSAAKDRSVASGTS